MDCRHETLVDKINAGNDTSEVWMGVVEAEASTWRIVIWESLQGSAPRARRYSFVTCAARYSSDPSDDVSWTPSPWVFDIL
ncbi:hypothetical protein J6590_016945 [Homalodisca vitripennis]|nr:hypothetical protein J6590_016945 [Homalodisca vitripennis]